MKFLFYIFAVFLLLLSFASPTSGQSCTGYGTCCDQFSIHCVRKTDGYEYPDIYGCNSLNLGSDCNGTRGSCLCTVSYTRTCSSSCVSNACAVGDYLIEDICSCVPVDGTWGSWSACYVGGGGLCIHDRSCIGASCGGGCDGSSWEVCPEGSCSSPSCPDCGTFPACFSSYCDAGCTLGCSSIDCFGGVCNTGSSPSCTVSLVPNSVTVVVGGSQEVTALPIPSDGTVNEVLFSSESVSIASVSPLSDSTVDYVTTITGEGVGDSLVTADVTMNEAVGVMCTTQILVHVTDSDAWWQVKDGDVQTNGDLNSSVPGGNYFDLVGLGGFPGVPKYWGTTSLTSSSVSESPFGWLSESMYAPSNNRIQNYAYLKRLIPGEVTFNEISSDTVAGSLFESGGIESEGYYWYEYDGGLALTVDSDIDLPDGRKVVILVDGTDLNIQGSINYTSGESILVVLVNGNINIDPSVGGGTYDLQGFFVADGNISTGISAETLHIKGSMAALGTLNLQRDLGTVLNSTTPSEVFEYDPATIFLFPQSLSIEKTRWKEVAP